MSLDNDLRLKSTFVDHPKTLHLLSILDYKGGWALLRLWSYAANYAPTGHLPRDPKRIAMIAQWNADANLLVNTLLQVGFLDDTGNSYYLHAWHEYQTWLLAKQTRVTKAQQAALARWSNDPRIAQPDATNNTTSNSQSNATSNAQSNATSNAQSNALYRDHTGTNTNTGTNTILNQSYDRDPVPPDKLKERAIANRQASTLNEPANAGLSSSGPGGPSDDELASISLSVSLDNNTGRTPERNANAESEAGIDREKGKDRAKEGKIESKLGEGSGVVKAEAGGGSAPSLEVSDSLIPDVAPPSGKKANEGGQKAKGDKGKAEKKAPTPNIPKQVLEIYHEVLSDLPKVRVMNDQLKVHIKARTPEIQKALKIEDPIRAWRVYFGIVKECPFLLGDSNTAFKADLQWLARPTNAAKVLNGRYLQDRDIEEVIESLTGTEGKDGGEVGKVAVAGETVKPKPIADEKFSRQLEDFGVYLSEWYYKTRDFRDASIAEGFCLQMMSGDPALKVAFERWGGWEKAKEVCREESVIDENPVPRIVKELWTLYREARLEIEREMLGDGSETRIIKMEVGNEG